MTYYVSSGTLSLYPTVGQFSMLPVTGFVEMFANRNFVYYLPRDLHTVTLPAFIVAHIYSVKLYVCSRYI